MECLQIDWKNIDGTYEKDEFYESIQAPKWIDFTVPLQPVDDHAWFCGKVGCSHEKKIALQAVNQESKVSLEASQESANTVAPLAVKTTSASVGGKKVRGVVSSSLSSLSDIKAAYTKSKHLHHTQMPSINESKGEIARNARWQQASENENPNRACKFEGACKKSMLRALEGIAKKTNMSESKGIVGKEESAHVPERKIPTRIFKTASLTLAEQVNLSQSGPVLEASKSAFIFGKKNPMHAKSTLNRVFDKDTSSDFSSISEAKIKKTGGTRPFLRPQPTARNPHLTASLVMPLRRSAANARPLHGVYLGNDKVATCKPARGTKDVRVTVHTHACKKKTGHNEQLLMKNGILQQSQKDKEMQTDHTAMSPRKQELCLPLLVKNDELEIDSKENNVSAHRASRHEHHAPKELKEEECICDAEPSVPPMMREQEKHSVDKDELLYLSICSENKKLLPSLQGVEKESKANTIQTREKEDSIQHTLEKFLENLQLTSNEDECGTEQDTVQTHHHMECATERNRVQSHHEDPTRCSPHDDDLSHMSKPLRSQGGSVAMPAALQMSIDVAICMNDKISLVNCEEQIKKTKQKEDLKIMKNWQSHRGRKRKSSELNFKSNCSSRDHKHEMQTVPPTGALVSSLVCQQLKQSSCTTQLPMLSLAPQPHGFKEPCEEHHKRMKTTIVQAFKPFRFRTEERGALKELGLGRRELNSKEMVHQALRMPSFGHPFRPQRSTKKLTIPREPKFHPSKTRKACTSHATL